MVKDLSMLKDTEELCPDCVVSKHHRNSIPKTTSWRASNKLELTHSDICGPINPSSNGGCRYFITFTDDFSRKTWTYPLKDKSSALEVFRRFKALVEKESNHQIKYLRTDRGGEFASNPFNEFCRMNVPKRFWPEAVVWATHVINRSPTLSVKDRTPEEAWSEMKPSVAHFKKNIIISRDVVFDEKQGWKWNEKGDKKEIQLIDDNVDGSVQVEPVAEDPVTTEPAVQSDSDMDTTSEEDDDNIENA
ncbi:unnamed protein product [Trifolium pratense]|uniref:Uncharacterized protein n=1 Tax=Trifolium pratense TaxID=57577 RepID=A0ACB0KCE5_TRIPR|nr:unnamed protein product [Trifolium pratense]